MMVCLKPLGLVDPLVLEFLQKKLSKIFGECSVLLPGKIPIEAYNPMRRQYNSTVILRSLSSECDIVLGITDVDIFAGRMNFVFGEAELGGSRAIISLTRLKPEMYGMRNGELLKLRALKEAMHEIGHVLGLEHCQNPKCVMYFSNWMDDTDRKENRFCDKCK